MTEKRLCVVCGARIPQARVDILPNTKHCVKCVDEHGPKKVHDPDEICAKSSLSCQNGFAGDD